MRYLTSTIVACTFVGTVGLFAQQQTPATPPQPQPETQPSAASATPKATLTGCVTQAKTTDGGTAYVLNKAEGGSAKMYVLGGSPQTEWSVNVNKKVEVIGPVQEPPNANANASSDPKVLRPPLVIVESTRVVAESCQ